MSLLRSAIRGAAEAEVPVWVTCSSGPLSDRTRGFSCLHDSISPSSGDSGRCLAESFERFLRRKHRYSNPSNAAIAIAPNVQPSTISRVLLLPPPSLSLPDAAFAAVGNIAAELEVEPGVLEGLDVGDADVDAMLLEDVVEVEELVDDVEDESLLDVVEAVVAASTEVTTV